MQQLEIADLIRLESAATTFDQEVMASVEIDHFCSSTSWILPAHTAFHSDSQALVTPVDHGFIALARGQTSGLGRFYAALEAMWGLACPIVGRRPDRLGQEAARMLLAERRRWDVLWLGGLVQSGELFRALVQTLGHHVELRLGPTARRHRASLDGGFDAWLGRRSRLFRKRIRQSMRNVEREGIELDWVDGRPPLTRSATLTASAADGAALFDRILAVEKRSWKGADGTGFVKGDMKTFYQTMIPRLLQAGRLRVLFARADGEDVAVCFGGILGDTYRGLQNSFDDRFRALSLGNAMQAHTIVRLCEEGIRTYDLGSEMAYKARWAEGGLETVTLIAVAR